MLGEILDNQDNKKINVKRFIIGGDTLNKKVAKKVLENSQNKHTVITNVYGPTECCVDATYFNITNENIDLLTEIPIGKPLPNYQVLILNEKGKLQPIGVPGELCIAGASVCAGYLNQEELTNEKFVKNVYTDTSQLLYKTGDIARWLPDGNLEFRGRMDYQVKIRGYRIELSEIDNAIMKLKEIKLAVTIAKDTGEGEKTLYSYIVLNRKIDLDYIKDKLKGSWQMIITHIGVLLLISLKDLPL